MCLATSLAPTHVPPSVHGLSEPGHVVARDTSPALARLRSNAGCSVFYLDLGRGRKWVFWEGLGEVAHEPAPGRPSLIIPHLGRLRRAIELGSRPEGRPGLSCCEVIRVRTTPGSHAGTTGFPRPASPHPLGCARCCWDHLPQYPCHWPHKQARDTRGGHWQTPVLPAKKSVDRGSHPWGSRPTPGPRGFTGDPV